MSKAVTGLLMGALATGALAAMAPAAQAAQGANLKDCQAAAKIAYQERVDRGDLVIPRYECVPDGDGWRVAVTR